MSGPAPTHPCFVFALRRESLFFRRSFPPRQRVPGAPCRAYLAGPPPRTLLVLETGLGAPAMECAADWLLSGPRIERLSYRPPWVVLAGFSGALQRGRQVGHLVLASEILDEQGNAWPAPWPGLHPPGGECSRFERGRLLTTGALVASPPDKERLGQQYGAVAVDMESAVLARRCHREGVPFGCLRAISDDAGSRLSPALVGLLRRGRVAPGALLAAVCRSPGIVAELWSLARNTRTAARTLAEGLGELLRQDFARPSAGEAGGAGATTGRR